MCYLQELSHHVQGNREFESRLGHHLLGASLCVTEQGLDAGMLLDLLWQLVKDKHQV